MTSTSEATALLEGIAATLPLPMTIEYGADDGVVIRDALGKPVCTFDNFSGDPELAALFVAAPALAATVVALGEERDRLLLILRCERGEWAPEGWEWCPPPVEGERLWMSPDLARGFVILATDGKWYWSPAPKAESVAFTYALEAIEAADAASVQDKPSPHTREVL